MHLSAVVSDQVSSLMRGDRPVCRYSGVFLAPPSRQLPFCPRTTKRVFGEADFPARYLLLTHDSSLCMSEPFQPGDFQSVTDYANDRQYDARSDDAHRH